MDASPTPAASMNTSVTNYWVTSHFNGFLYHINLRTQEMMLHMADSFEQPDTTTYIWNLKPGIKFHDVEPTFGREVTADDCVYSFTRRLDDPAVQNDKQLLRDFAAGWEAVTSTLSVSDQAAIPSGYR